MKPLLTTLAAAVFASLPCQGALSLDLVGREMDATLTLLPGGANVFGNSSFLGPMAAKGYRDFISEYPPVSNEALFTIYSNQVTGNQFSLSIWFGDGAIETFQPGDLVLTIYGLPEAVGGFEYSGIEIYGSQVRAGDPADYPFAITTTSDGNGNTTLTFTNSGAWQKPDLILKLKGNFTAVPEPAPACLVGIATAGFMGLRRRPLKPARKR